MSAFEDVQGEQGLHEVNGGDLRLTRWERFLCCVQTVLVILFLLSAWPLVAYAMANLWTTK